MTTIDRNTDAAEPLDDARLAAAAHDLAARDADLAAIVAHWGPPPLWARPPGFSTLIHIILEQQVSLASARAAYDRLLALAGALTPATFLALDDAALRRAGFSRQKAAYGRHLAQAVLSGQLDLAALAGLGDDEVRARLTAVKGIGHWTADVYLLMCLLRPDVWPSGDLALVTAVQRVKRLEQRPSGAAMIEMGAAWRPWRAVAARLFWVHYLANKR
jgi:DNA-3-methyladenine glycosylase II